MNKSLQVLKMNQCGLDKVFISYFAEGLSRSNSLQTIHLNDNYFNENYSIKAIVEALTNHKGTAQLQDIDLQKCALTNESVKPLAELIQSKYKIRSLNLTNNAITDEGARELLAATQVNPFIIKFKLDLNPTRTQFSKDIESITSMNF